MLPGSLFCPNLDITRFIYLIKQINSDIQMKHCVGHLGRDPCKRRHAHVAQYVQENSQGQEPPPPPPPPTSSVYLSAPHDEVTWTCANDQVAGCLIPGWHEPMWGSPVDVRSRGNQYSHTSLFCDTVSAKFLWNCCHSSCPLVTESASFTVVNDPAVNTASILAARASAVAYFTTISLNSSWSNNSSTPPASNSRKGIAFTCSPGLVCILSIGLWDSGSAQTAEKVAG